MGPAYAVAGPQINSPGPTPKISASFRACTALILRFPFNASASTWSRSVSGRALADEVSETPPNLAILFFGFDRLRTSLRQQFFIGLGGHHRSSVSNSSWATGRRERPRQSRLPPQLAPRWNQAKFQAPVEGRRDTLQHTQRVAFVTGIFQPGDNRLL
jgi:hypothetical protein